MMLYRHTEQNDAVKLPVVLPSIRKQLTISFTIIIYKP